AGTTTGMPGRATRRARSFPDAGLRQLQDLSRHARLRGFSRKEVSMALTLYAHPFSSYCQKVLIALYENGTPFTYRKLESAEAVAELTALWPMSKMPVLVDGERTVMEATVIVEYLQIHHPGAVRLLPEDPAEALEVRLMDRFFDNY